MVCVSDRRVDLGSKSLWCPTWAHQLQVSNTLNLERSEGSNIGDRVWQSLDIPSGNWGGVRNGHFFGGKFGRDSLTLAHLCSILVEEGP